MNYIVSFLFRIFIIFICILTILVWIVYRKVFCRKKRTVEQELVTLISKGLIGENYYENLVLKGFSIKASDNCQLAGYLTKCSTPVGCVLLSHGISSSHAKLLGHVEFFKSRNFDVFLIDQRGYGKSSKSISTYGVKEKEDLLLWLAYLRNMGYSKIGILGHSMGASAALLTSNAKAGPDFIIAESAFSSFNALLRWQLKQKKIPNFPAVQILNIICKIFHGFSLDSIDVLREISGCHVPLLFIHGKEDKLIPYEMSKALSEASNSEFYAVDGCGHSIYMNIDNSIYEYEKKIDDFLKTINL